MPSSSAEANKPPGQARWGEEGLGGCVFVGALDYKPNIDGVIWFCRTIWPRIRAIKPNAIIKLVGREPTADVRALGEIDGVEVVGTVPDVRPYLSDAAVAVVPLQIARGVQNKVLEAMAMGKAIVASPEPIVGLQAEPGVHLVRAATPDEWVERVTELLDDADLRAEIGTAGMAYVNAYHRWEQCLEPLGRILECGGLTPPSIQERTAFDRAVDSRRTVGGVVPHEWRAVSSHSTPGGST